MTDKQVEHMPMCPFRFNDSENSHCVGDECMLWSDDAGGSCGFNRSPGKEPRQKVMKARAMVSEPGINPMTGLRTTKGPFPRR